MPQPPIPADDRWAAVAARDATRDGQFVFAVRTTGVYCRPSCPSRRPLRNNVSFFATPQDAAAAGFRACLRCSPDDSETPAERAVARARDYLDAHADAPVTLAELAQEVGMSPHHLQRTFKRIVGVSPKQYASALRADRLKTHLRAGSTVSRATYDAGFGASSRVYDAAERTLGMTPAAYRRGGRGMRIRFATSPTAFGTVLVAATDHGVCSVMLGDDPAALERALADEFPNAERLAVSLADGGREDLGNDDLRNDDLRSWTESVTAHLAGTVREPAVQLDIAGTPLQQRVWTELRRIPYGETRTYSEVAAAVGAPKAVRAVAAACARNPVALVVPCHRVVQKGGRLAGYRWGIDRKARLLAHEQGVAVRLVG